MGRWKACVAPISGFLSSQTAVYGATVCCTHGIFVAVNILSQRVTRLVVNNTIATQRRIQLRRCCGPLLFFSLAGWLSDWTTSHSFCLTFLVAFYMPVNQAEEAVVIVLAAEVRTRKTTAARCKGSRENHNQAAYLMLAPKIPVHPSIPQTLQQNRSVRNDLPEKEMQKEQQGNSRSHPRKRSNRSFLDPPPPPLSLSLSLYFSFSLCAINV